MSGVRRGRFGWLHRVWQRLPGVGRSSSAVSPQQPTAEEHPSAVPQSPAGLLPALTSQAIGGEGSEHPEIEAPAAGGKPLRVRRSSRRTPPNPASPFTGDFLVPRSFEAGFVFDLREGTIPTEQRVALDRAIRQSGLAEAKIFESILQQIVVLHHKGELSADIVWANWEALIEPALTNTIQNAAKGPRLATGGMDRLRERSQRLAGAVAAIAEHFPVPLDG